MVDQFIPRIPNACSASFEELVTSGRPFVDKTAFLKPLLYSGGEVTQLLRPRNFGRSLSMNMLASFVEMNYQAPDDRSRQENLFQGLDVLEDQELCNDFMGRYPVVSISLGCVGGSTFPEAMQSMLSQLRELFAKFNFLQESPKQSENFRQSLRYKLQICAEENFALLSENNLRTAVDVARDSLGFLSYTLFREYGRRSMIIVDDYDVPLQQATAHGYYDDMLRVVIGMMGSAMKGNNNQENGFFTGCINIAHQSIYTGFNNYSTSDINDPQFADFMGFTREETAKLLRENGMEERLPEVIEWYGGYNIAGSELLCPASVMRFITDAQAPGSSPATFPPHCYRNIPSEREIIETCMRRPKNNDSTRLQSLIDGKAEKIFDLPFTTYPLITSKTPFGTSASLLLGTGCFALAQADPPPERGRILIRIPNKELLNYFSSVADQIFSAHNPAWLEQAGRLRDALFDGTAEEVQDVINSMLTTYITFSSTSHESYYQCFLTEILELVSSEDITVTSIPESVYGYSAVTLRRNSDQKGVIIAYKECEDDRFVTMDNVCDKALELIRTSAHSFLPKQGLIKEVVKYGIAFTGKYCQVKKADPE